MWKCPKCGREFKNTNQDHFCGEPPKTIDAYISEQPDSIQPLLHQVRSTIHTALPDEKALPLPLIAEIAKWCYETGNYH